MNTNELLRDRVQPLALNTPSPIVDMKLFDYNKDSRTFMAELSDLQGFRPTAWLRIKSPTGFMKQFRYDHADSDGSHEDIYGWHYVSLDGQYKILIIND